MRGRGQNKARDVGMSLDLSDRLFRFFSPLFCFEKEIQRGIPLIVCSTGLILVYVFLLLTSLYHCSAPPRMYAVQFFLAFDSCIRGARPTVGSSCLDLV